MGAIKNAAAPVPDVLAAYRDGQGMLESWAWPGGYPLYYICKDGGEVCPACANLFEADPDAWNPDQTTLIGVSTHWEGEPIICEHCNGEIESAYGVPETDA